MLLTKHKFLSIFERVTHAFFDGGFYFFKFKTNEGHDATMLINSVKKPITAKVESCLAIVEQGCIIDLPDLELEIDRDCMKLIEQCYVIYCKKESENTEKNIHDLKRSIYLNL